MGYLWDIYGKTMQQQGNNIGTKPEQNNRSSPEIGLQNK